MAKKTKKTVEQSLDKEKDQVQKAQDEEKDLQKSLRLNLSEDEQKEIVERICELVKKDEADRTEYIAIRKKTREMYEGKVEPKNTPWKNCANVKTQLVHMAIELLHSRLYPSAYNEDLIYWRPQEKTDIANVENVKKFMKWAVRFMKLAQVIDDFVHNLILDGTAVMKLRWTQEWKWVQRKIPKENSIASKLRRITYMFQGGKKQFEVPEQKFDIKYEYKKFETCKAEVIDLDDVGFPTYSVPSSNEEELEYIWHRSWISFNELKEMEAMGQVENVDKIGKHIDEGLTKGMSQATIDAEGVKITQNKLNTKSEVIEFYDKYDISPKDGVREDVVWTVDIKSKTFMDGRPLLTLSRINERPFVIGQFIRRTNRMLGKGAGEIAVPYEEEANAIHNQRLDAGTMSITPFGVYRAGSGFKPEDVAVSPGLMVPVDDVNDMKWMTVPNNTMVSFQEERMLMELLEKILSVGSYQSGQESDVNRSRSTARGTLAIIQQGEVRFAILAKRVQMPLVRALNKILKQWQDKMPPGIGRRVLGEDGIELFPEGIAPEDLAGGYDAYLVQDSTGGSKRADQEAKAFIYTNFVQNPLVMQNPPGFWQLSADALKASGVYEDPTEILGEKPVQSPTKHTVQDENTLMMQGVKVKTDPRDNVMEHLIGHSSFRDSADFATMPPEYRLNFDTHLDETKLQLQDSVKKMQTGGGMQQPMQPQQPQAPLQQGMMNEPREGAASFPGGVTGMAAAGATAPGGAAAPGQVPAP